jgi:hypothetical protein
MAELQARVARFGEISLRHVPAAGTVGRETFSRTLGMHSACSLSHGSDD